MQIKNRYTEAVIFEDDNPTMRETVGNAVKQKVNLARAYLAGADLAGAYLAGADLAALGRDENCSGMLSARP